MHSRAVRDNFPDVQILWNSKKSNVFNPVGIWSVNGIYINQMTLISCLRRKKNTYRSEGFSLVDKSEQTREGVSLE